jgi:tetratricopeptide (TPR) repeat protein
MTRRLRVLWLVLPALALVAAGPAAVPPDELVRRANDALGRKQYNDALKLYDRAEERSTDPGLVAFDEGVAFYQKGDYAEAEVHFRLARQDATGPRQVFAAYNLAASIVRLPGDADPAKLAEAIRLFEDCLRHEDDIDEHFAADARHNLELAKMLWVQAKARPNSEKQKPPDDPDEDPKKQQPRPEPQPQPGQGDASASPATGNAQRAPGTAEPGQEPIKADGQQTPGEGKLPVIPDREELAPMSREEAEAHLRQAIEKVMKEGRAHRQQAQKPPSGKVRDW